MKPRILILGAGFYYSRIYEALSKSGFYLLSVDRYPNAYAFNLSDEYNPIDIMDSQAVLAWSKNRGIDGIMAINDFGTRTASFVSQSMGLIGLSPDVTEAANDKGLMRDIWKKSNLSIPSYQVFSSFEELVEAVKIIGYPCVLKPTDSGGGGRGISVISTFDDLEWAFDFAKPYVKNNRYILEEFIEGTEMTIEAISIQEKVHILAMSDKFKPNLRTRVATSLNYPADFPPKIIERVKQTVTQAILAIGVTNGMSHTEVIVSGDSVKLIEMGARGGGGHIFHTLIEAVSGINAPVMTAKILTGQSVTIDSIEAKGGVYRFFNPPPGILREVIGLEKASQVQGVLDIGIIKKIGDSIGNLENSLQRAGFVVTSGETRQEAIKRANYAESLVKLIIE